MEYLDDVNLQLKSTFQSDAEVNKTYDLRQNGFQLTQMLISCMFDLKPCSVSDFVWFYSFDYGNCYRFNGNNEIVRVVKKAGPLNGLRLNIFFLISNFLII